VNLFNEQINGEQDWEAVFLSVHAFTPLVEHIFAIENLTFVEVENLTPGTHVVFKVGEYVVKIYAPPESGIYDRDLGNHGLALKTDLFTIQRAHELNVPALNVIASGTVEDKYRFDYMITEFIESVEFATMTDADKIALGRKLRRITDIMNTPCEPFTDIDVINDEIRHRVWDEYPEQFRKERLSYIKSHDYGESVFIYGDLCGDNFLLTPHGEVYIIDFAPVIAPKIYEHAQVALDCGLDPLILQGYFEDYTYDAFVDMCFNGLLILDYDPEMVEEIIGKPEEFQTLDDLRKRIKYGMRGVIDGKS